MRGDGVRQRAPAARPGPPQLFPGVAVARLRLIASASPPRRCESSAPRSPRASGRRRRRARAGLARPPRAASPSRVKSMTLMSAGAMTVRRTTSPSLIVLDGDARVGVDEQQRGDDDEEAVDDEEARGGRNQLKGRKRKPSTALRALSSGEVKRCRRGFWLISAVRARTRPLPVSSSDLARLYRQIAGQDGARLFQHRAQALRLDGRDGDAAPARRFCAAWRRMDSTASRLNQVCLVEDREARNLRRTSARSGFFRPIRAAAASAGCSRQPGV